jgi:hypothetical protein
MVTRSIQVNLVVPEPDRKNYSDLQVLKSAAGWYVGTLYISKSFTEPGSRDTDYFDSEEVANKALKILHECSTDDVYEGVFDLRIRDLGLDLRGVGYRMRP